MINRYNNIQNIVQHYEPFGKFHKDAPTIVKIFENFETIMFDPVSNPTILIPYICIGLLIMALAYGYMNSRK